MSFSPASSTNVHHNYLEATIPQEYYTEFYCIIDMDGNARSEDRKDVLLSSLDEQQKHRIRKPTTEEQALIDELEVLNEKYGEQFPHICKFVQKEAERVKKGWKSYEEERILDIEGNKPIRQTYKITVPLEKYPEFNYVGRLLGPKGATLQHLQAVSGCKLAVLGKGSMKDKDKEEKYRLEGGKYAHLNEPLHVFMQAYGIPEEAFFKLHIACREIGRHLHAGYNDGIYNEQMAMLKGDKNSVLYHHHQMRGSFGWRGRGGISRDRGLLSLTSGGDQMNSNARFSNQPRARGYQTSRGGYARGHNTNPRGVLSHQFPSNEGRTPGQPSANSVSNDSTEPSPGDPSSYEAYQNGTSNTDSQAYYQHFPVLGSGDASSMAAVTSQALTSQPAKQFGASGFYQ